MASKYARVTGLSPIGNWWAPSFASPVLKRTIALSALGSEL